MYDVDSCVLQHLVRGKERLDSLPEAEERRGQDQQPERRHGGGDHQARRCVRHLLSGHDKRQNDQMQTHFPRYLLEKMVKYAGQLPHVS